MEIDDDYENQFEEEEQDISQEDAWTIISAYFEDKGLVCQQLDSFDEFIQNTMQETVDELCSASTKISDQSLQIFGCQSNTKRKRDRSNGECSVSLLLLYAQFMSEEEAFRLERFSLPAISHSQKRKLGMKAKLYSV